MDNKTTTAFKIGFMMASFAVITWGVLGQISKAIDATTRDIDELSRKLDNAEKEIKDTKEWFKLKSLPNQKDNHPMAK